MQKQPQNGFNALREMQKHPQNSFNALREMQKQPQNSFPKIGKTRKCLKTAFPKLGNEKNEKKRFSQDWEAERLMLKPNSRIKLRQTCPIR